MRTSLVLRLIASAGIVSSLSAQEEARQVSPLSSHAQQYLQARVFELGLDATHDFSARSVHHDEIGADHIRVDQYYQGVKVFGGEAIVHMQDGAVREVTDALVRGIRLNPTPTLGAPEAMAAAHQSLAPVGAYANAPTAELVFANIEREIPVRHMTMDGERTRTVSRMALVYHIHTELENGAQETSHTDFFVDAHSGEVLESWSTLHTAGVAGTGKSQWYGSFPINTNSMASGFEMRDMTRGTGGNVTYNLNHATSGTGTIYTDVDNTWGQLGAVYGAGSTNTTTGDIGQTAAVDGHNGLAKTWDFYKNVFARNGIDNAGKATYSRMHYSTGYDNAFWSDSCFCMTYGDGAPPSGSYGEADLDTCGHEMTHGVTSRSANLAYRKESGGLNEATSDILGTMVEFWALGGASGSIIPNIAGSSSTNGGKLANYKLFENSWGHAYPSDALRWMHKPSRDGASPDFYKSTLGRLDVHYSSGVANHFFFLLAHGSQIDALSENEQSPMTNGVTSISGIGNDKAARIWYKALTAYMTSSTNYAGARTATLNAATSLYGASSAEYAAVNQAWLAVNVK